MTIHKRCWHCCQIGHKEDMAMIHAFMKEQLWFHRDCFTLYNKKTKGKKK